MDNSLDNARAHSICPLVLRVAEIGWFCHREIAGRGDVWGNGFSFQGPLTVTIVSATLFPLLNPLVEELQYRGYALGRLEAALASPRSAILISASGFGLQHIAFAMTLHSAIAFFLWGIGAGIIVHKQGRLFPLLIAHFISNLFFGLAPLFFLISQGSG